MILVRISHAIMWTVSFHSLNLVLVSCLNRLGAEEAEDEQWGILDVYAYNIGVRLCAKDGFNQQDGEASDAECTSVAWLQNV